MASRNMTSNTEASGTMYRWIERKPLTEAVSWTSREKFWLITAACHFGTHDWKSVAQVVRNAGEQYRPKDWYTSKSCERQFKVIVSNLSKELKALPLVDMLQHIAEGLRKDYLRDANKSKDSLKTKYCNLFSVLNRVKQGNLSRNEVVSLYSQARRNEIEGKQYMEQLMTRQNASLASENSSSGLSEETIKWNTPSAPLLTSLLRSRNTIPTNRTVTTIASLLQSPGGTSRTRSGKMLPLSSSVRTTSAQGTPTLSKLLEAPANPYLSSPPLATQKNKTSEVAGTDKLVGNTPRKENSLSTSLNKVRVDNVNTSGSFNQINKSDLSTSKKQSPKSPVSAVKSGLKSNSNIVSLLSDSDDDEENCKSSVQNIQPKEKKDTNIISRIEPRATRSQTRAEGSFKQLNDNKISDGKKERDTLRQENGESQLSETHHSIEDDLIDIDQIEVEPLSSVQDEIITQTPSKVTRSSVQRSLVNTNAENLLLTNKVKSKEINNQMLEEISANFVLNSTFKNVATEYKNVMVGRSRIDNANIPGCIVPIGGSAAKETIIVRKDGQSFPTPVNMLTTFDGKILKQKRIIDLKGTNIKCIDGKLSFTNPVVLLKKPFNIKLASELKNKNDEIQIKNNDPKKTIRINNIPPNLVQLLDANQSLSNDDVTLSKDVNVIVDDKGTSKINKLPSKESQNLPLTAVSSNDTSNVSAISKSTGLQLNEKKTKNDKTMFNVFGKPQNLLNIPSKKSGQQDSISKIEVKSNINEPNNRYIKELDFDFDQSISQTSLSELYNGVEEIVEMHSFDNEELNSLIECDSLDNSETEEPQNTIIVDHGDSSVSESDSTIGAFDTFAQITGVPPKLSSSKDIKFVVKKPKVLKQGGKDLEHDEGFVQSDEIDDDQSSSAVSVTGIPVLQNVISDVMSKIDSDRNASLNEAGDTKKQINVAPDIIELSSDEEEKSNDDERVINQLSSNVNETNNINDPDLDLKTKMLKLDVFSVHQINEEKNNKLTSSTELQIVKAGMDSIDRDVQSRLHNVLKTFVDKKLSGVKKRMNLESGETNNENTDIDKDTVEKVLILAKENQINKDMKEVKRNEEEEKVPFTNEMAINSKELITSRISNEKHQEASTNVKDLNEKLLNEDVEKYKKDDEKKVKDVEIIDVEQSKEFEAEIIQRGKKIQVKKAKVPEMTKISESETKKIKEIDLEKEKEIEIKKAKEIEIKKAKEIEINKAKEIEMKKAKEMEMKKTKEIEIIKAKEIEAREAAAQKALEIELQKDKEAQVQRIKDDEIQQAKETEILRKKEAELIREAEMKKSKEAEVLLKAKEEEIFALAEVADVFRSRQAALLKSKEMQLVKVVQQDLELQTLREDQKKLLNEAETKRKIREELRKGVEETLNKSEETELKRTKEEIELREAKNIEIKEKEAELKKIKEMETKEAQLKKAKEIEMKMGLMEVHVSLSRQEVDQSKKANKSEQSTYEAKKVNVEETGIKESDMETIKSKEQSLKSNKFIEIEGKKVKETKEIENKINTRNRGSKIEEKLKDSYPVSKTISVRSTSAVKSLGTLSNMMSSTTQTKNISDVNKPNDDTNKCDRDLSSSEPTKYEVSGKSRTRSSSSFKKNTSNDTTTSFCKSNDKSEDVISKATVGAKRRILTSSHTEISSPNVNLQRNTEISRREALSKAISENYLGKQLTVPLVKISTNRKPYYTENVQHSDNGSVKQPVVSIEPLPQKTIDANEKIEKPTPKKRGRKRRIDVQMANSDQQNLQNGAAINTSSSMFKEMEPLAKRTRRSTETRDTQNENVAKSSDIKNVKKECLKYFYKMLNDKSNSHLSLIEKEVGKDLPPETNCIVKSPVYLQAIEKKINSGEMKNISRFAANIMMMAYNVIMTNRSDSAVFDDISCFQDVFANEYFQMIYEKVDGKCYASEKEGKNIDDMNKKNVPSYAGNNKMECITIDEDEDEDEDDSCNDASDVQNENETKTYNRFTRSNKESSSDSEFDRALPPKKRKKKYFIQSNSNDVDSDCYDSDFIF